MELTAAIEKAELSKQTAEELERQVEAQKDIDKVELELQAEFERLLQAERQRRAAIPVDAIYYPNTGMLWKVRLADGANVLATTDAGANTHDRRHFVDCRLVRSLSNGEELMAGLLPADPACTRVRGTKGDDRVLGMLAQPLVFTAKLPMMANGEKRLSRVALDKVLVIEHLPVPLHVSWNCLAFGSGLRCGFTSYTSRKQMQQKGEFISPDFDVYVVEDAKFDSRNLPVEYQTHPYWHSPNIHQIMIGQDADWQLQHDITDRQLPHDIAARLSALPLEPAVAADSESLDDVPLFPPMDPDGEPH